MSRPGKHCLLSEIRGLQTDIWGAAQSLHPVQHYTLKFTSSHTEELVKVHLQWRSALVSANGVIEFWKNMKKKGPLIWRFLGIEACKRGFKWIHNPSPCQFSPLHPCNDKCKPARQRSYWDLVSVSIQTVGRSVLFAGCKNQQWQKENNHKNQQGTCESSVAPLCRYEYEAFTNQNTHFLKINSRALCRVWALIVKAHAQ